MNSSPPRSVWQHPRYDAEEAALAPAYASPGPQPKTVLGKLKAKWKAELEEEKKQKETQRREILERYSARRAQVLEELVKDGNPGLSDYVGPPPSPYGGVYRGLTPRLARNLGGWLA
ncbi:unnamed protein product [Mycena citricolor]|uniref:Uncharacterized protein n=1 Tax=Mycena citricolor TaxID=2018698 RepID=A0AAD2H0A2_9AGAR|nr:unnamed protein product [Mycena citricolor]